MFRKIAEIENIKVIDRKIAKICAKLFRAVEKENLTKDEKYALSINIASYLTHENHPANVIWTDLERRDFDRAYRRFSNRIEDFAFHVKNWVPLKGPTQIMDRYNRYKEEGRR